MSNKSIEKYSDFLTNQIVRGNPNNANLQRGIGEMLFAISEMKIKIAIATASYSAPAPDKKRGEALC